MNTIGTSQNALPQTRIAYFPPGTQEPRPAFSFGDVSAFVPDSKNTQAAQFAYPGYTPEPQVPASLVTRLVQEFSFTMQRMAGVLEAAFSQIQKLTDALLGSQSSNGALTGPDGMPLDSSYPLPGGFPGASVPGGASASPLPGYPCVSDGPYLTASGSTQGGGIIDRATNFVDTFRESLSRTATDVKEFLGSMRELSSTVFDLFKGAGKTAKKFFKKALSFGTDLLTGGGVKKLLKKLF